MPNKMERFTGRARRVLSLAQEEAERLEHSYIGTEHLLIGIMREEVGVAARVLRDLGLDQRGVQELVERMTPLKRREATGRLELSPGTKKVLELAVDEARRMGHHYIGTEHLLLGLVRHSEGIAIDVLKRLNVKPEEVRRQVRRVLQESPVKGINPSPDVPSIVKSRGEEAAEDQVADKLSVYTTSLEINAPSSTKSEAAPALRLAGTNHSVLFFALIGARRKHHSTANTAHLLLQLLIDKQGAAGRLLRTLGLDWQEVNEMVKQTAPSQTEPPEQVRFAPDAISAIGTAVEESILAGNPYVRTEHLLLAIIRQKESPALDILKQLNVSPEQIEKAVRDTL